jgi:hypothetical protein
MRLPSRSCQRQPTDAGPVGRGGVDVADIMRIMMIGDDAVGRVVDVRFGKDVVVEPVEGLFRLVTGLDPEMVDELHSPAVSMRAPG